MNVLLLILLMVPLLQGDPPATDSVTLRGTTIPIACTIERIESSSVQYTDQTGRMHQRPIEDIEYLSFAGLNDLDDASRFMMADDYRGALRPLMRALLKAEDDMQRLWIHAQLAQAHDIVGEPVQAAGHFAAAVTMQPHASWLRFTPRRDMNESSYAAAAETMHRLQHARRHVQHAQLSNEIERLLRRIEPIYRASQEHHDGVSIDPGSTVSGIAHADILDSDAATDGSADQEEQTDSDEPPDSGASVESPRGTTPNAIGRLLEAEQWDDAVAACKQAAADLGRRDIAQFLYQYGLALQGADRPRDAAIMFTRCAILHTGSPYAPLSLIETAVVYRDIFDHPDTSRRLLERAQRKEQNHRRDEVLKRIDEMLRSLGV